MQLTWKRSWTAKTSSTCRKTWSPVFNSSTGCFTPRWSWWPTSKFPQRWKTSGRPDHPPQAGGERAAQGARLVEDEGDQLEGHAGVCPIEHFWYFIFTLHLPRLLLQMRQKQFASWRSGTLSWSSYRRSWRTRSMVWKTYYKYFLIKQVVFTNILDSQILFQILIILPLVTLRQTPQVQRQQQQQLQDKWQQPPGQQHSHLHPKVDNDEMKS